MELGWEGFGFQVFFVELGRMEEGLTYVVLGLEDIWWLGLCLCHLVVVLED